MPYENYCIHEDEQFLGPLLASTLHLCSCHSPLGDRKERQWESCPVREESYTETCTGDGMAASTLRQRTFPGLDIAVWLCDI